MAKLRRNISFVVLAVVLLILLLGGFIVFGIILRKTEFSSAYMDVVRVLAAIAWFIASLITIIEFVSLIIDKNATIITSIYALAILLAFSFSHDAVVIYFGGTPPEPWIHSVFATLNFFFTSCALLSGCAFLAWQYKMIVPKREALITVIGVLASVIAYGPLSIWGYEFISFLGLLFFFAYFTIKLILHLRFKPSLSVPVVAFFLSIAILLGGEMAYTLGHLRVFSYMSPGLSSISTVLVTFLFLMVYMDFIFQTTRRAYRAEKLENTVKTLQSSVLKEQISPHFLFNSLQAVKTNYRLDQDKGDLAIDLLSKHLRTYVEGGNSYLVPFTKELDSVMTFTELVNLRTDRPFNIIYDIDEEDFEVPTLSIEPLIENAILYSGVNDIEDGHIEISSYKEGDSIIIRIQDNGKGFDLEEVREGAVGIKNCFERFRLLLNAECSIDSQIGGGTRIKIEIPPQRKKEADDK